MNKKRKMETDGLEQLRIERDITISKWKKLGLLDGLKPMSNNEKRKICELFECNNNQKINENEVDSKNKK